MVWWVGAEKSRLPWFDVPFPKWTSEHKTNYQVKPLIGHLSPLVTCFRTQTNQEKCWTPTIGGSTDLNVQTPKHFSPIHIQHREMINAPIQILGSLIICPDPINIPKEMLIVLTNLPDNTHGPCPKSRGKGEINIVKPIGGKVEEGCSSLLWSAISYSLPKGMPSEVEPDEGWVQFTVLTNHLDTTDHLWFQPWII